MKSEEIKGKDSEKQNKEKEKKQDKIQDKIEKKRELAILSIFNKYNSNLAQ